MLNLSLVATYYAFDMYLADSHNVVKKCLSVRGFCSSVGKATDYSDYIEDRGFEFPPEAHVSIKFKVVLT